MTAPLPPDPADVLTRLEELHNAATPGEWSAEPNYRLEKGCRCLSCWEPIEGSWDINPIDGPDCPEHGCWHNVALSEADAAAIVAEHNAMPALLAAVRRVLALAEDLATHTVEPETDADRAFIRGLDHAADRIRRALAGPDDTQQDGAR